MLQWPVVFGLVATGIGLLYYFGPDADQDWVWITPGAIAATILWLLISLLFKMYIANFTDYEGSYGTVGGVIVVLLWFYVSGLAILTGAELNAEIEHASPYGKAPGQKNAQGKLLLGARAARAFRERQSSVEPTPSAVPSTLPLRSKPGLGADSSLGELLTGISTDVRLLASQTLALARVEVSTAASKLAWSGGGVLASVLVAAAGTAVLVSAVVLILIALGLPAWAASTLVGVVLIVGGGLAARSFISAIRRTKLGLEKTRASLRETLDPP